LEREVTRGWGRNSDERIAMREKSYRVQRQRESPLSFFAKADGALQRDVSRSKKGSFKWITKRRKR